MGNGVVANDGCYHDQKHINESCPTEVPAGLVPAAVRARRNRQGGVPVAAERWGTPGMRPRFLPLPWVTYRLG